jgi:2'-5' RNA ligase
MPEPLRSWLVRLRNSLPVEANSEPHVTILPPRPLMVPLEEAEQKISSILDCCPTFEIEFSGIRAFPETNVLYLDVDQGAVMLRDLHSQLNAAEFYFQECFDFHPHLTIGGPVPPAELEAVSSKAAEAWRTSLCPARFQIEEVSFVSILDNEARRAWRRLWTHKLTGTRVSPEPIRAAATNRTS